MARVRSPAYPALSLPAAVDMIRKVHSVQQTTPEPRDVVIKHMGYSGPSGRSLKALSALIKYGFLENKEGDELNVSERAIAILFPDPDDPDRKDSELIHASREPSLYGKIFERWEDRPSEESLKSFLIREGFNANSVDTVARSFYETYELVSDLGDSQEFETDNFDETKFEEEKYRKQSMSEDRFEQSAKRPKGINVTTPVFDFETVEIHSKIDNQEDLNMLITRLEKLKQMLPEKSKRDE